MSDNVERFCERIESDLDRFTDDDGFYRNWGDTVYANSRAMLRVIRAAAAYRDVRAVKGVDRRQYYAVQREALEELTDSLTDLPGGEPAPGGGDDE